MRFLSNLKLRKKMLLAFTAIILIMMVALVSSMFGLNNNREQIANLRHISNEAHLIQTIESELLSSQKIFKEFYISGNAELIDDFERHLSEMNHQIEELKAIDVDIHHNNLIFEIERKINDYNNSFSKFHVLDKERLIYYNLVSDAGNIIISDLKDLQLLSETDGDLQEQVIISTASTYLMQARLHAMKYFTFHETDEYNLFKEMFSNFTEQMKKWPVRSSEYLELMEVASSYQTYMIVLKETIDASDQEVELMDTTEIAIVKSVGDLEALIEEDEANIENAVTNQSNILVTLGVIMTILSLLITMVISRWLIKIVLEPIESLRKTFVDISKGEVNVNFRLNDKSDDEIGMMSKAFNQFMVNLKDMLDNIYRQDWLKTAFNDLNTVTRTYDDINDLSQEILKFLCYYIEAPSAVLYIKEDDCLIPKGSFGVQDTPKAFSQHQGLIGQCSKDNQIIHLDDIKEDYLNIETGLLDQSPNEVLIIPCSFNHEVVAVLEIATRFNFSDSEITLLKNLAEPIGIALHATLVQNKMKQLLEKTLTQSEELQVQQEELRQSNEELEEQTRALKESEALLQHQREELSVSNEELEERALQLEQQKKALDETNHKILIKQEEIIEKATALEKANAYKSEFLANMSHELRTPLNSILVLSQLLSERNQDQPFNEKEREFAQTIFSSGTDLLRLINDILDLSKVEAGHLDIHMETFELQHIIDENNKLFKPITNNKNIDFIGCLDDNIDPTMTSDYLRIQQILKNLISNAIKFTSSGHVKLHIRRINDQEASVYGYNKNHYIAFEVSDTGIGIADEKQQLIFEAFKQSDGTTSRKYGGTGLGLTISKELSELLKGQIYVESKKEKGSTFTLILPYETSEKKIQPVEHPISENMLLIVEDDKNFAHILKTLSEEKGFDVVTAHSGREALNIIESYRPAAVLLDLGLPDMDGLEIAKLLDDSSIPVHIISGNDDDLMLPNNVIGYLKKPVDIKAIYQTLAKIESLSNKPDNQLLVVGVCGDEDFNQLSHLGNIKTIKTVDAVEALSMIHHDDFDCIIVDYEFKHEEELFIFKYLEELRDQPIIIYSEKQLESHALKALNQYAENIILRSDKSNDRLIDEVSLFLHGMKHAIEEPFESSTLYTNKRLNDMSVKVKNDDLFQNKSVLIVDDDERNVFALSHALKRYGFEVHVANDGYESIEKVDHLEIDLILMDIMMPKMDGYEAIRKIRTLDNGIDVPIIALTAKAMKNDRVQCIEAGANDYMTKPIDMDKLISTMKVWLA